MAKHLKPYLLRPVEEYLEFAMKFMGRTGPEQKREIAAYRACDLAKLDMECLATRRTLRLIYRGLGEI